MYFVYILYSEKCKRHYVGYSTNVNARLIRHNKGIVASTKNCIPYTLKAYKSFETEKEAKQEEAKLKKMKSKIYLEKLISGNW